ncbi:hypothetical protein ACFY0N_00805 [Streptomyces vinaceus]|uniref:hypothetical protein n=1 Tax=Streptomyces vinaceus TaxID=1960 RepID=UPI00368122E7
METALYDPRPKRVLKRGECPVCAQHKHLTSSGRLGRHQGLALSGALTGEQCPGVGELHVPEKAAR